MVQIPPRIVVSTKQATEKGVAADYLESTVSQWSKLGWEFYRVDTIGVVEQPGCLASLLGGKSARYDYYVVTFRKTV